MSLLLLCASPLLAQAPSQPTPDPMLAATYAELYALTQEVTGLGAEAKRWEGSRFLAQGGFGRLGVNIRADVMGLPGEYKGGEFKTFRAVEAYVGAHLNAFRVADVVCGPTATAGYAVALADGNPTFAHNMSGLAGLHCTSGGRSVLVQAGSWQPLPGVAGTVDGRLRRWRPGSVRRARVCCREPQTLGEAVSGFNSLPDNMLRRIEPEPMSGCWLWSGPLDAYGYASVSEKRASGKWTTTKAHRLIYKMLVGPITKPTLDHLCRIRSCVNPDHLRPATNYENIMALGSLSFAKAEKNKTCCARCGGEFTFKWGSRRCLPCRGDALKRWLRDHPERRRALWRASYHRRKARQGASA